MSAAGDEAGTVAYATGWWFLAGALLVTVVVWHVGVLVWWRGGRREAAENPQPDPLSVQQYLDMVDCVAAEHVSRTINGREAHHRLSALARRFLEDSSGRAFSSMTLEEIRERDEEELVKLVEPLYRPAFAPRDPDDETVGAAIAAARALARGR